MIYVIIALIVLLAFMIFNAVKMKPEDTGRYEKKTEYDFDRELALKRFQNMLRKKTIWPRDAEPDYGEFRSFLPMLKKDYPEVFKALEVNIINDYGILLKWKGSSDKKPVVLMAHYDVVAVDEAGWDHEPFGAEVVDGSIYARGTSDTKCIIAGLLEAVDYQLAHGYVPERDIYFSFTNNEETGGPTTPAIVRWFEENNIVPWFVLDEGGAIINDAPLGVKDEFAMIGVSEKGVVNITLKAKGLGGHSSTPSTKTDSTYKLVRAINRLNADPFKKHLHPVTEKLLGIYGSHSSFLYKFIFGNMWLFRPIVMKVLESNKETAAMISTTAALTQLKGAPAVNIIPPVAEAGYSVRIAPGDTIDSCLAHFRQVINDPDVELSHEGGVEASPVSPIDNSAYRLIQKVVYESYSEVYCCPYIQNGATDSRNFHRIYPNVYRFAMFRMSGAERQAIHGNNESIRVSSYYEGISAYINLLTELNNAEE
ncbi:MAG: M20/M25/M40 family metallo-hydrolase [Erysipelotrichaceae bacterium]|nr:M20/M25/M40 family metallo-hydrolase [Erysipelotrichaceae bacterium]